MYKKILAPVDGSDFSECSLEHVRAIATGCHVSQVVLLMVVEPPRGPDVEWLTDAQRRDSETRVHTSANEILSKLAAQLEKEGIAADGVVVSGNPAEEILNYTQKNQVDLIVMSTHGRTGVSRWTLGSVADKVLRHSVVPVLVASPPGCRLGGLGN
jgi:nucleotide-binding universal stress UspA family protein